MRSDCIHHSMVKCIFIPAFSVPFFSKSLTTSINTTSSNFFKSGLKTSIKQSTAGKKFSFYKRSWFKIFESLL